jgi:DNA-binding response OmpR family regulator
MVHQLTQQGRKRDNVILIGEDDMDDKEIIEEAFFEIDPSVKIHFVNNGKKLLSFLEEESRDELPSLIVIDYNMPGLNGAEILKSLGVNKKVKNIPKVIWSTSGANQYKSGCLALGAYDYLVKPSTMDELKNLLKYMLSLSKAVD